MWISIKNKNWLVINLKEVYDDRINELIRTNSFGCELYSSTPPWVDYRSFCIDVGRAMTIEPKNIVGKVTEIDFDKSMVNFESNELGEYLLGGKPIIAVPRILFVPNKLICFDISVDVPEEEIDHDIS